MILFYHPVLINSIKDVESFYILVEMLFLLFFLFIHFERSFPVCYVHIFYPDSVYFTQLYNFQVFFYVIRYFHFYHIC